MESSKADINPAPRPERQGFFVACCMLDWKPCSLKQGVGSIARYYEVLDKAG